jgi:hypothetical protein
MTRQTNDVPPMRRTQPSRPLTLSRRGVVSGARGIAGPIPSDCVIPGNPGANMSGTVIVE